MTLSELWLLVGDEGLERVAAEAGTRLTYLKQLMYKPTEKQPALDMAVRLVEASGNRLTFRCLMKTEAVDHRSIRRSTKKASVVPPEALEARRERRRANKAAKLAALTATPAPGSATALSA